MIDKLDKEGTISRIRQVRSAHAGGRGKALFAKELGINPSTYNYYEKDRVAPVEILWAISEVTGVDLAWLITDEATDYEGQGATTLPNSLKHKIAALVANDPSVGKPLGAFVDLRVHKSEIERSGSAPRGRAGKNGMRQRSWLPILGRTAAGVIHFWPPGQPLPNVTELSELIRRHQQSEHQQVAARDVSRDPMMVDVGPLDAAGVSLVQLRETTPEGICEFIDCPLICKTYPDAIALRVDGDSMSPHIQDGAIVILSPSVSYKERPSGRTT